tara:strand:- start:4026 stop:4634 length:609 start_codon:yes stop_codon:yes gene_type:complete
MNKTQILTDLFNDDKIHYILKTISKNSTYKDELTGELFLILCEMSEERIIKAYTEKYLVYMVVNILKKQYNSSTSPFYKKYKNAETLTIFPNAILDSPLSDKHEYDEKILNNIDDVLSTINFTDREIFKMYYKIGEYNMIDGKLKDETCKKPTSSTRKIAKKLCIGFTDKGNQITITPTFTSISLRKTIKILKNKLNYDFNY